MFPGIYLRRLAGNLLAGSDFKQPGHRHCERSEAIHAATRKSGLLRFARNDAAPISRIRPPSRDAMPELCRTIRPKQRAWGMPGARRTRSLVRKIKKHTSIVTTGSPRSPDIPARDGFNGFLRALPGDRAGLPPSSADTSANLTPASGRQDHTTSPSAIGTIRPWRRHVHRIPFQRP